MKAIYPTVYATLALVVIAAPIPSHVRESLVPSPRPDSAAPSQVYTEDDGDGKEVTTNWGFAGVLDSVSSFWSSAKSAFSGAKGAAPPARASPSTCPFSMSWWRRPVSTPAPAGVGPSSGSRSISGNNFGGFGGPASLRSWQKNLKYRYPILPIREGKEFIDKKPMSQEQELVSTPAPASVGPSSGSRSFFGNNFGGFGSLFGKGSREPSVATPAAAPAAKPMGKLPVPAQVDTSKGLWAKYDRSWQKQVEYDKQVENSKKRRVREGKTFDENEEIRLKKDAEAAANAAKMKNYWTSANEEYTEVPI